MKIPTEGRYAGTHISNEDQFIQIMSNPLYCKIVSKAMHHILNTHLSNRSK